MRILKYILLVCVIAACSYTANAQQPSDSKAPTEETRRRWMQEYRQCKQEFLTKEMNLNQEQQTEFFPLYNEMEDKVMAVRSEAKEAEQKASSQMEDASDEELAATAKILNDTKAKEAAIESEYFNKFSTVLSGKQQFLLKRAEEKFQKYMLQHHRKNSRKQK